MSLDVLAHAIEAGRVRKAATPVALRRAHGVVHTPAEVARWAMQQVDARLRGQLGCTQGLSNPNVSILDPALGTGIWLAAALERMQVPRIALALSPTRPELLGFEIDADAAADAATLLAPSAERAGVSLAIQQANMLAVADPWGPERSGRVRVIVGNPPWSARSRSRGIALSDAWLAEFRSDADGVSLGERRSGVLSDDYVRFFRWALEQARTSQAGAIVCFATNSSYLDGPVHRGMRAALVNVFDQIDILDLGGNALRGSDGARDENVFGVRVGACITLAVRSASAHLRRATVSYGKLRGDSAEKLARLTDGAVGDSTSCLTSPPFYRFQPQQTPYARASQRSFSIAEAFPFHREGVQTNRDAFVTDADPARLLARLTGFAEGALDYPGLTMLSSPEVRATLRAAILSRDDSRLSPLAYRPLDDRFCLNLAPLCHRPRPDLSRAVAHSRFCLLSARKDRGQGAWNLFAVSRTSADGCYLSTRSSARTRVFPSHDPSGVENLDPRFGDALSAQLGEGVSSESCLSYCVGVLASPSFRADHDAELHNDYPRLPWPKDASQFETYRLAGRDWLEAWLSPWSRGPTDAYDEQHPTLTYDAQREQIRWGDLSVDSITPEAWSFAVGDFPVLKQLTRVSSPDICALSAAIQRVRACMAAAACADLAYQLTRPVG